MARMTMRTREAPMDWEREHDRNLPNIFSTPQPLESEKASGPPAQRSSPFGSSSNDRGHLSKESSFTFQDNQKPFGQDSQVLGSKQGSFGFSRENSLSRPQSPSGAQGTISSGLPSNVSSRSIIPAFSSTKQLHEEKRTLLATNGSSASSFDMDSLKNNVLDHDNQLRSRPRSASRREMSGPLLNSNRNRSGLQYRSNTAPSSFWSDDDEVDDQDSNGVYDADEEEHQDIRHRHKLTNVMVRYFYHSQEALAKTGRRPHRKALKTREVTHYVGSRVNLVHRPTLRLQEESGQRM
ncbi:hypothetical protein BGZ80_003626 [Entomortierella chlamydospora]|uniref:Uncharacterized protein n=1 Tax=Entomortierella chlamydospora TaxID=101097 RepID=A0A9P6SWU3_9FUNG|nr:hypothetical protein BGZ80_003626 [Entomortierella chlamydospora]